MCWIQRGPLWYCTLCRLSIQSNTVLSCHVQVNACKRLWGSRRIKGWKALDVIFPSGCTNGSHVKKRGKHCTVKSTNTDDATSHYFSLRQESIDLLQVNLGFLSKQYFSHLCHCELPKVNTNSEATSWAEPCLWPPRGFEPIFTWQTQWSVEVKKKGKMRKSWRCETQLSHYAGLQWRSHRWTLKTLPVEL